MKFFFYSLGCKVNSYEISCLKRQALCLGNEVTRDVKKADVIVINTCTVTQMSSKKSRQKIRSFRRDNSKAVLIAMGCFTEEYLNESLFDLGVDIALGNNDKETIFSLLDEYQKNQKKILCNKVPRNKQLYPIFDKYPLITSARPYVKIQDGCDAFCTYCIIPLVRGKSRSRKPLDVIDEIKTLVENDAKEIVITGIHIGLYGKDFKEPYTLSDLLELILKTFPDLPRVRISSLEIMDVDDKFIALLKDNPRLVSHLHLPLQSGSTNILKKMGRPYDQAMYLEKIRKIQEARPGIAITSDVMVGFPTETEEDFLETVKVITSVPFREIHVFPYSVRPNTRATLYKDLDPAIKKERVKELLRLNQRLSEQYEEQYYGKEVEVLIEKIEDGLAYGHTDNYLYLAFPSNNHKVNDLVKVIFTKDNKRERYEED